MSMVKNALFELYFQRNPRSGGFALFSAGQRPLDELLDTGGLTLRRVPEGTAVFPGEPVLTLEGAPEDCVRLAPLLAEKVRAATARATAAVRMKLAAEDSAVQLPGEHGALPDNTFIHCFTDEKSAFAYLVAQNRAQCVLPVDSVSVLQSGIPNAIAAFVDYGGEKGVRIANGDIAYAAIHARRQLDAAGLQSVRIFAGGALDEFLIRDLKRQGAPIDVFCVDTLPASNEFRVRWAVSEGDGVPKMTRSQNIDKITPPGRKRLWRVWDEDGKALADLLTLADETLPIGQPYTLFDPHYPWKKTTVQSLNATELLGASAQNLGVETLWDTVKRFENPHKYYVDYAQRLWDLFQETMQSA
ncbi:MAG: hypothetical protein LBN05_05320 [Oscillospiraceae bacterium]|jgi:nicotinate phosphoribosyltransferase|nr:hypothetical protein [Oscillospiraceae bacterium]